MSLRILYNSPVVLTFSILATAAYFINQGLGNSLESILVLNPYFDSSSVSSYVSLVGYTLGHADINHLMGNLSFILLLGPIIEEKYGSQRLVFMIIVTAIITGVFNIVFFETGLLGASGIVFMFIILVSFANTTKNGIPLTFILILVLYVGKEFMNSFEQNNVSEFAHIAGGVIGSLFGFMVRKRPKDTANFA